MLICLSVLVVILDQVIMRSNNNILRGCFKIYNSVKFQEGHVGPVQYEPRHHGHIGLAKPSPIWGTIGPVYNNQSFVPFSMFLNLTGSWNKIILKISVDSMSVHAVIIDQFDQGPATLSKMYNWAYNLTTFHYSLSNDY